MSSTLGTVVNSYTEDARGCLRDFPLATIVLSATALEATLYEKLSSGYKVILEKFYNVTEEKLEGKNLRQLIKYATKDKVRLLDPTNLYKANEINDTRNWIAHPTDRNLTWLAEKCFPEVLSGVESRSMSGSFPGEKRFKATVAVFHTTRINDVAKKILEDTEAVLKFLDQK